MKKTRNLISTALGIITICYLSLSACSETKNIAKNATPNIDSLFASQNAGQTCEPLAPPANKSTIESVCYSAGVAGMTFDSTFHLVSLDPKHPLQEISTVKSDLLPLIGMERIGKHFVQTHLKYHHKTKDYAIQNFTLLYLPNPDNAQFFELEYVVNQDFDNPENIVYIALKKDDETAKDGIALHAIKGIGTCDDGTRNQTVLREDGIISGSCKGKNTSLLVYKQIE